MLQVLTANWRAILPHAAIPIAISRGTPRRIRDYRRLRALEPGPWFRSVPPAQYVHSYREILDRLDPAEIYDQLLSYGDCAVMLCWESPCDCHSGKTFCHRHLVAQWLEDRLVIKVEEIGHPKLDRFAFLRKHGIPAPDYHAATTGKLRITSDNVASRNQK